MYDTLPPHHDSKAQVLYVWLHLRGIWKLSEYYLHMAHMSTLQTLTEKLHYTQAASAGRLEIVKVLLDHGASIDLPDNVGSTPLILASWHGCFDVVRELLARGASIDATDNFDGSSPLNMAAFTGSLNIVRELLAQGASVDLVNHIGATPLHSTIQFGRFDVVHELLAHDASVNLADNSGRTPLHEASTYRHVNIIKLLLDSGANLQLQDKDGKTARDYGDDEVKELLDNYVPDPSQQSGVIYSIQSANIFIRQALENASETSSEFITAASTVLSLVLTAQVQRESALAIGVIVQRIVRYVMRYGPPDEAHSIFQVFETIQCYFETTVLKIQPSKLSLDDPQSQAKIQTIADNLLRFQNQFVQAAENFNINLKVHVIGKIDHLTQDIGNMMDKIHSLNNYMESIMNKLELQHTDGLLDLAIQFKRKLELFQRQVALGNLHHTKEFGVHVESCQTQLENTVDKVNQRTNKSKSLNLNLIETWILSSQDVHFDPNDRNTFLGEGGFGSVFRGLYRGQHVAVKLFHQIQETDSADLEKRIAKEIKAWKDISHEPFILSLIGVCTKIATPTLVSELCETNIRRYVRDWPETIIPMIYQFACGLVTLENAKIIHRDLKADNVLITFQHTVAIADFGISRTVTSLEQTTNEPGRAGTLRWMSPEQYFTPRSVATKSDVWSFGMTLWEILCNDIPFRECSQYEFEDEIFKSEDDRPEKPEDLKAELELLWPLIIMCWKLSPDDRPSAIEIVDYLRSHYNSQLE
ncbi:hypothetical protein AeRB84_017098 [Aphanomyces euteiches]|nr:hypothetical protein AeRB84_017098 [Aphanomyces euteiches]